MNEKHEPIRDARQLGYPKMLLLGLQHMFAMFGATILVPILVNSYFSDFYKTGNVQVLSIQVTLFFAGVGTLFFHFCTKWKVPAFLGSSFAFLGGFSTIASLNTGIYKGMEASEKIRYACGGIVVAGLLYIVLAIIVKLVGVQKVMRFLPPIVTGPIIISIGLTLASSAVSNCQSFWPLAFIALAVVIMGAGAFVYGVWALLTHAGFGMYFLLFGLAAIFLFAGANVLPTSRNNRNYIEKQLADSIRAMEDYIKDYPDFPVPAHYAHPIVLERMQMILRTGRARTIPEALQILKKDLKALNSSVVVEQEEYEEIIAIKPMFLVMDYK